MWKLLPILFSLAVSFHFGFARDSQNAISIEGQLVPTDHDETPSAPPRATPTKTPAGTPSLASAKPLDRFRFKVPQYPANADYSGGPTFGEVMIHSRPGRIYADANPATKVHETMHHPNNDISEVYGHRIMRRSYNVAMGFFRPGGWATVFAKPEKITKSHALRFMPQVLRDMNMFRTYWCKGCKVVTENIPESGMDEMHGYAWMVKTAVEAFPKRWPRDAVPPFGWALEQVMLTLAYAKSIQVYEPGYLEKTPQFKEVLFAGSAIQVAEKFRKDAAFSDLRKFAVDFFGPEWTQQVMGI